MAPHSPAVKLPSRATLSSPAMGAHRWSHDIAKAPPRKIRIVHVLAPKVIHTDVHNFRDVVQRLTGKEAFSDGGDGPYSASSGSSAESTQPVSSDGAARGKGAAAAIKVEVKEEAEADASPEGFVRSVGEESVNDRFFQGLEDLLFSSICDMDGQGDASF